MTPQGTSTPDVTLTPSVTSLKFDSGTSGSATMTVAPQSGFTGTIALAVATPAGISCILSPASIQSSGTSILTCNSSTAGDYTVTILAAGGASPHTTTLNVHVAAVSPAPPGPSTILGLAPATFFGIIVGIIALVVAGTVLVLRRRGSFARRG